MGVQHRGREHRDARGSEAPARSSAGPRRRALALLAAAGVLSLASCDGGSATGPAPSTSNAAWALNSTGQTLVRFDVEQARLGGPDAVVDLGAGFDGDGLSLSATHAATSVSELGGSRVLFVDLATLEVTSALFPVDETIEANPSRPTFDGEGAAWVAGRRTNAVYRVRPGDARATRIAGGAGRFPERVIHLGDRIFVLDANLDDDGGTYAPAGPGRLFVFGLDGTPIRTLDLPPGALNSSDMVAAAGRLLVLAGGTFDPDTFEPVGDGILLQVDPLGPTVSASLPLGANGVSLDLGRDGRVRITTTRDFTSLDVLVLDPSTGRFLRGPDDPLVPRDAAGERVDCWTVTALGDGRMLCATFRYDRAGRLLLLDREGSALDELPSGFGTTDLAVR